MKKILLTYGYHESGHYSALRALEEEISARGIETETQNIWTDKATTIDSLFSIFRRFASKSVKQVPDFLIDPELLQLLSLELPFDLDLRNYFGIISTHHYSTAVFAAHKLKQNSTTPLTHVHTDHTPFPLYTHPAIDFYAGALPKDDVDAILSQKLVATGIPVRKAFCYDGRPKEKRILVLGGADGFGQLDVLADFASKLNSEYTVEIVCGRNSKAYEEVRKRFPSILTRGFVENISEHFNRAEFVITKASGLTVAEALNCECIPIFPPPILFWEEEAAKYICSQGAGICLPALDDVGIRTVNAILFAEEFKAVLRERGKSLAKPNAAKDIVDLLQSPKLNSSQRDQSRMVPDMTCYHEFFSTAGDLPKVADYLSKKIENWLQKHESHHRN